MPALAEVQYHYWLEAFNQRLVLITDKYRPWVTLDGSVEDESPLEATRGKI